MRPPALLLPFALSAAGCGGSPSTATRVYPLSPYASLAFEPTKGVGGFNGAADSADFVVSKSTLADGTLSVGETFVTSGMEGRGFEFILRGYDGEKGSRYALASGGNLLRFHQKADGGDRTWLSTGGRVVDRGSDGFYRRFTLERVAITPVGGTGASGDATLDGEAHVTVTEG